MVIILIVDVRVYLKTTDQTGICARLVCYVKVNLTIINVNYYKIVFKNSLFLYNNG